MPYLNHQFNFEDFNYPIFTHLIKAFNFPQHFSSIKFPVKVFKQYI